MSELKKKIEAILFCVGKFVSLEEMTNLCRTDEKKVKDALLEIMSEYEDRDTSLVIISDNDNWKLTTREEYSNVVRKVVSETELTKTQLETLAVIAFKYPIKQSDLIRIRTNKAYDHLMELERLGYITRQRYGRSKLIKLTDKFFDYFDLPRDKLKDRFKGFEQLAKTIENKESEIENIKEEQQKAAEEAKRQAEMEKKVMDGEIELDEVEEKEGLETYEAKEGEENQDDGLKERLGNLDVVNIDDEKDNTEDSKKDEGNKEAEEEKKDIEEIFGDEEKDNVEDNEEGKTDEAEIEDSIDETKEEEDIEDPSEEEAEIENNTDEAEEENSKQVEDNEEDGVDLLEAESEEESQKTEGDKSNKKDDLLS